MHGGWPPQSAAWVVWVTRPRCRPRPWALVVHHPRPDPKARHHGPKGPHHGPVRIRHGRRAAEKCSGRDTALARPLAVCVLTPLAHAAMAALSGDRAGKHRAHLVGRQRSPQGSHWSAASPSGSLLFSFGCDRQHAGRSGRASQLQVLAVYGRGGRQRKAEVACRSDQSRTTRQIGRGSTCWTRPSWPAGSYLIVWVMAVLCSFSCESESDGNYYSRRTRLLLSCLMSSMTKCLGKATLHSKIQLWHVASLAVKHGIDLPCSLSLALVCQTFRQWSNNARIVRENQRGPPKPGTSWLRKLLSGCCRVAPLRRSCSTPQPHAGSQSPATARLGLHLAKRI